MDRISHITHLGYVSPMVAGDDLKLYTAFRLPRAVRFGRLCGIPETYVVNRSTAASKYLITPSQLVIQLTRQYVGCRETQPHTKPHQSSQGFVTLLDVLECCSALTDRAAVRPRHLSCRCAYPHKSGHHQQTNTPEKVHESLSYACSTSRKLTERHHGGVFSLIHSRPMPLCGVSTLRSQSIT
jgi:hypothetical protein